MIFYQIKHELNYSSHAVPLPFPCELIGQLKDIAEEVAKEYVKSFGKHGFTVYLDYRNSRKPIGPRDTPCFYTALESLNSFVESTGLKGNVIILKRKV